MTTRTVGVALVDMDCWCGVPFAIPENLFGQYRRSGHEVYCPLGHSMIPLDRGENAQLKRRLTEAQDALSRAEARAESEKRSAAATRGQLTKVTARAAAGVCPYCHRSFASTRMAAHVKSKHPEATA